MSLKFLRYLCQFRACIASHTQPGYAEEKDREVCLCTDTDQFGCKLFVTQVTLDLRDIVSTQLPGNYPKVHQVTKILTLSSTGVTRVS